jgi:hypothetical protein
MDTRSAVERNKDRRTVQLPITRAEHRRLHARARRERMALAHWLAKLALRELKRKPPR